LKKQTLFWRLNSQIQASTLRVIGPDGAQLGIISREEALKKAKEAGLDLVEITSKVSPPVVKIVNFALFRYAEEKKLRAQKKKAKAIDVKEVRFSPFIAEGDYATRLGRVKEFLNDGCKVRAVVVFKGRQMNSRQFGYELLRRVTKELGDRISIDMEPKFLGRHLAMVISPLKKAKVEIKENEKIKNQEINNQEI